jgi:hypothetical protein
MESYITLINTEISLGLQEDPAESKKMIGERVLPAIQ